MRKDRKVMSTVTPVGQPKGVDSVSSPLATATQVGQHKGMDSVSSPLTTVTQVGQPKGVGTASSPLEHTTDRVPLCCRPAHVENLTAALQHVMGKT